MQVQSLVWEDPLKEDMTVHSSILAQRIAWTEEPGRLYSPQGCKELGMTEVIEHTQQTKYRKAYCSYENSAIHLE